MRRFFSVLAVLVLFMSVALSQNLRTISGNVVSGDDGEPIIGVSVVVKGTRLGVTTDIDGNFELRNLPPDARTVVFSYIGMKSQELPIRDKMQVRLESAQSELDEVVVTGMQKVDKRLFTGATAKVSAEQVKLDGIPDVSRALEGRVAGVSVQNVSGTFGTAPKIRVRGATSIYGSSKPLWVIDGIIQEDAVDIDSDDLSSGDATTLISNAIAGLSADDIESFQVLKDGSATSIYGARAMAGVVVITTKRGKSGQSHVNYTGEFTYRLKPSYRNYNICNSQEQLGVYKEMEDKGWLEFATLANGSSSGLYGTMYKLMKQYDETSGQFGMPFTQNAMNAYLREAEFRNTDWFDLLYSNKMVQNHSASISTGNEKANLYASLSFMDDQGWTKQSAVQRYTANLNATFNLSKFVSVTLLTNGSYRDQKAPGTLSRSTDVVSGQVSRNFDINPFSYALNTSRALDPTGTYTRNYAPFNIFKELDNNYIDLSVADIKFQGEAHWKPIKGLEFMAVGAYRVQKTSNEHFVLNESNQAEAYRAGVDDPNIMDNNSYLYTDPDKPNSLPVSVMKKGGIYRRNDYMVKQYDFRGTVDYNTKIVNEQNLVRVFAGMEANKSDRDNVFESQYGVDYKNSRLVTPDPLFFKQALEEGTELASFRKSWTRGLAYFISPTYSFDGKYILNGTLRYEGTNKLGKARKSRWLPTWNVSGAWNAYEEEWFKDFAESTNQHFSHLVTRISYSLTADRGPSFVTNARPVIGSVQVWRPQGDQVETALSLSNIANTELTYEKKHEFNIGADLGFLNNKLNVNVEVYWRDNYDLIGILQTEGHGGFIDKYANVADMKSHGYEGTISSVNYRTKDWKWTTDFTFSYAANEITNLKSRSNVIDLVTGNSSNHYRQGYPVSALFSIPFKGLNDEGLPTFINQDGEHTVTDVYFQEFEKLGFLKYEGPTEPTITGGLNNAITWKNWRLNIFFTYAFGNKVRLDPVFSSSYSDMTAMSKEFKNRWVVPGDEKKTDIPAIAAKRQVNSIDHLSYAYNSYNYSTARVANGGFIRLKDVSLTYDLPKEFLQKIGISTASVKLDGTNLCLLYSDKKLNGQDPEFVNSGGVASPLSKQFTFTLRIGI